MQIKAARQGIVSASGRRVWVLRLEREREDVLRRQELTRKPLTGRCLPLISYFAHTRNAMRGVRIAPRLAAASLGQHAEPTRRCEINPLPTRHRTTKLNELIFLALRSSNPHTPERFDRLG